MPILTLIIGIIIGLWLRSFSQSVDRGSDETEWAGIKSPDIESQRELVHKLMENRKLMNEPLLPKDSGKAPIANITYEYEPLLPKDWDYGVYSKEKWDKLEKHISDFVPPKDWGKVNGEKF